jgi:hypothetical protein
MLISLRERTDIRDVLIKSHQIYSFLILMDLQARTKLNK